jgi:hypothetical protein
MARPSIAVDQVRLALAVSTCEAAGNYTTRQQLWQDVALAYGGVSPAWVYLKVEELNIPVKTPKGKKGRQKGQAINTGVKIGRGAKFAKKPEIKAAFKELEKIVKQEQKGRFLPIFNKMVAGSMKAAVKLNCLECSNFQTAEIKYCPCVACPMYAFRPYQNSLLEVETEEGDSE